MEPPRVRLWRRCSRVARLVALGLRVADVQHRSIGASETTSAPREAGGGEDRPPKNVPSAPMMLATIATIAAQLVYDRMTKNLEFRAGNASSAPVHCLPVMPDSATACGRRRDHRSTLRRVLAVEHLAFK
jgi:hypothetical protein